MKKYEKIYKALADGIACKTYGMNQLLPSENELANKYNTTRTTVRQALKLLEDNGMIQRSQGRGSIVISDCKVNFPTSSLTANKEIQDGEDHMAETECLVLEKITVDAELAAVSHFQEGVEVWHVQRQRKIDGLEAVLDSDYVRTDVVEKITKRVAEKSLYHYFENRLHLDIAYAKKTITVDAVRDCDFDYLALRDDETHVVRVQNWVYLTDATQFQYTESRHLTDKFAYTEFNRRTKL
jgi:GntR family trehalose operon transcriptional repressor